MFGGAGADAVSGVTLADNDTVSFGLDGADFSITWTPGAEPAGYLYTSVYMTTSSVELTEATLGSGCGGQCMPMAQFSQHSAASLTVPDFRVTDSSNVAFATDTSYVAWVYTSSTSGGSLVSSTAVSYATSYDSVADTNAPQLDHMGVSITIGGTTGTMYAFIFDDQTTAAQFVDLSDATEEYFNIVYGTDVSDSSATSSAVQVDGDLFSFTVPAVSVPAAGNTFEYYLVGQDGAATPNVRYFCSDPNASDAAGCEASPFIVTTVASGNLSFSGTVTYGPGQAAMTDGYVFAGGYGGTTAVTTTDGTGAFTLTGLVPNNSYDFTAHKDGYCRMFIYEVLTDLSETGYSYNLAANECGFYVGGDDDMGNPFVTFSSPPEGSFGMSTSSNILVGFDRALNPGVINDAVADDAQSNVYLTTDDGSTKVAGKVTFCEGPTSPGCGSISEYDSNVIMFDPNVNLTSSTFYTLVINESVTDQGGRMVAGNKAGGGHEITFTTAGETYTGEGYGTSGAGMPPYVKSMIPAPGTNASPNTSITVEFSEMIDSSTVNSTNFTLMDVTEGLPVALTTVDLDNRENRFVSITFNPLADGNEYELRVKGAVSSVSGITLGTAEEATSDRFFSSFFVSGSNDTTAPTIYPMLDDASTGLDVFTAFEFGFSEQMDLNTLNNSNITMRRGSNPVSVTVTYNPGPNSLFITPGSALSPSTAYTVTFSTSTTDLAGNELASVANYTYTTGAMDTVQPILKEARCDDYSCAVFFSEPMMSDGPAGNNWAYSTTNPANWTILKTNTPTSTLNVSGLAVSYDPVNRSARIEGTTGLVFEDTFQLEISTSTRDLSENAVSSSLYTFSGSVESSANTYGDFGGGGGMFGPPIEHGGGIGGEFKPEGFGSFTGEQFMFGQADMAFAFNSMAGQDVNVFQTMFTPDGVTLIDDDQIVLTFPNGTNIANVEVDTYSPFFTDFNEFAAGTIAFDTDYSTDGVAPNNSTREVTVQVEVTGTITSTDPITIDLRKIVNPNVPKGPETGGYTVGIKIVRAGATLLSKETMPYYINEAGANDITVRVFAGSATSSPTAGADGSVFMFGGGPSGPLDKAIVLEDGAVTSSDGVATSSVKLTGLPDGCYHFGTEPFVTLGGADYFGQFSPEPLCVSGGQSGAKDILLTPSGNGASVTTTVKLAGIADFGGIGIDIFAGGPGRFVVKNLTNVTTPAANGYDLQLPSNGNWFVGVGPAMPKGSSGGQMVQLPGVPPPPIDLIVSGIGSTPAITTGFNTPPGVTFDDDNDIVTFTFAAADKTITGTVTDGTTALSDIEVFVHQNGFGAPMFDTTDINGTFSIDVSDYGSYEIGAFKHGLPPSFRQIEVRNVADSAVIFYKGEEVTGGNPLVLTLKKPDYYISGKVLDTNGNGISYAPVFGINDDGDFIGGGTGTDGSYTLFVDAGTWLVKSELPPDKTDTCGTFSRTVIVTTENQTGQNISPSVNTCYTLSGTVSVGGTGLANVPIFIDEWDTANGRPLPSGMMRGSSSDSSGAFSVKVGNGTYKVGTWHPDYGELSATATVSGSNVTDADLTMAATGNITFAFTGGQAGMDAFVELKNSTDATKRFGKQHNGLDSNLVLTVQDSVTYNYFVDVFGIGDYSGTAAAGDTVTIDVSADDFITVTGTIKDASGTVLSGALVTFSNSDTDVVKTGLTNAEGNYSVDVKADTYSVNASLSGYIAAAAVETAFIASTTGHSFATGEEHSGLTVADQTITGVLKDSSAAAMEEGYVWAENAVGVVVKAAIDPDDGTYSLAVNDGTWTVKGAGPLHDETIYADGIIISGSSSAGNNLTLDANTARTPTSSSGILAANVGGSIDDSDGSGVKITAGSGVLESGSGNVTLNLKRNYTAPDSETFEALSKATFEITANGNSTIKNLTGNAEIQFDYTDLVADLPSGVAESDLHLMYYSPERAEYVPVEGGFTIDAANNTITGMVDHFTDFVVAYSPVVVVGGGGDPVDGGDGGGGGGGASSDQQSVGLNPPTISDKAEVIESTKITNKYVVNEAKQVTVGGSTHTVTFLSASAEAAQAKIESDPITVDLEKDVSQMLDTSGDGVDDLKVTYKGLDEAADPKLELVNLTDDGELDNAITINSGAYETDSLEVVLTINAEGAEKMALSSSSAFTGASYVDYATTSDWTLTEGNGVKTVYVKFRSTDGGTTNTNDTITLTGQGFDQEVVVEEEEEVVEEVECDLTKGGAYKHVGSPAVYYITSECTKRAFKRSDVFFTYFDGWSDVVVIKETEIDAITNDTLGFMPWGPKYDPKYGALVKIVTDPKVYLLLGTEKYWITSEVVFETLNYAWNWIEDIAEGLLDKYTLGSEIDYTDHHPNYTLIKYENDPKVYRLEPDPTDAELQVKRYIPDEPTFESLNFRWDRIVTVGETEEYADGELLTELSA